MNINRIYVDHVALAWSLTDSVRAQRDARESSSRDPARWRAQSTRRTASIGGNGSGDCCEKAVPSSATPQRRALSA
jgi:hypothetical protein